MLSVCRVGGGEQATGVSKRRPHQICLGAGTRKDEARNADKYQAVHLVGGGVERHVVQIDARVAAGHHKELAGSLSGRNLALQEACRFGQLWASVSGEGEGGGRGAGAQRHGDGQGGWCGRDGTPFRRH